MFKLKLIEMLTLESVPGTKQYYAMNVNVLP
jgi:hypothetical protein